MAKLLRSDPVRTKIYKHIHTLETIERKEILSWLD